jgi:hypothetical protein
MSNDHKRDVDILRATANVVEILIAFPDEESRMQIIVGAFVMGIGKAWLVKEVPEINELLKRVKPQAGG